MMTVNKVSKLTGVSIRTLQYYDKIGLLHPAKYTESGYRLYDDKALENLIAFAHEIQFIGGNNMDFKAFDTSKIDEYIERAKEQWGKTSAYKEFEEKTKNRSKVDEQRSMNDFMQLFVEFGEMKEENPAAEKAQKQVKKLQKYISEYFYHCTDEILYSLGQMYSAGGEFTENIDKTGGKGTTEFITKAIEIFCQ